MNKKTTSKSKASPAPATKTAPASKAKATKSATKKTVAVTPAEATAGIAAIAAKAVTATPVTTTVAARFDVGFGNTLYVRGEGPGLSWDRGVLMTCVESDLWQVTLGESARPFALKFLINDTTWSTGPDYTVESGSTVTFTPSF